MESHEFREDISHFPPEIAEIPDIFNRYRSENSGMTYFLLGFYFDASVLAKVRF